MVYNTAMVEFFPDPSIVRLPPGEVRLTRLRAVPLVDRIRLHVDLELTPFEQSPNIELELSAADGQPCGSTSIIEPANWKMALNMHLRCHAAGKYRLVARLSYPDLGQVDEKETTFTLPEETR